MTNGNLTAATSSPHRRQRETFEMNVCPTMIESRQRKDGRRTDADGGGAEIKSITLKARREERRAR